MEADGGRELGGDGRARIVAAPPRMHHGGVVMGLVDGGCDGDCREKKNCDEYEKCGCRERTCHFDVCVSERE